MPHKTDTSVEIKWSSQLLPLAGLVILGSFISLIFRGSSFSFHFSTFTDATNISANQLCVLVLLSAATVIYLAYLRAKLYFSTRWLIAAVTYNVLILFVKFTLSTKTVNGEAIQSFGSILATAFLVSLLYIFAFTLLYLFFDGKLLNKSLHKALIVSRESKVLLAMGLFIVATLARILVFRLPLLSGTAASTYLGDVFKSNTALLSALLFIMILAAVEAFAQVRRRADLKYFFTTGVIMILAFHFWWAIFVYRGY